MVVVVVLYCSTVVTIKQVIYSTLVLWIWSNSLPFSFLLVLLLLFSLSSLSLSLSLSLYLSSSSAAAGAHTNSPVCCCDGDANFPWPSRGGCTYSPVLSEARRALPEARETFRASSAPLAAAFNRSGILAFSPRGVLARVADDDGGAVANLGGR